MSVKNDVFSALAGFESRSDNNIESTSVVNMEELAEAILDKDYANATVLVVDAGLALDKIENKIEYLEDTVEELEEEVAGLEAMISGKVDFNAALAHDKFTRAAKIASRLNGKVEVRGVESFTSKDAILTIGGMESLKDTIKKGAEATVKFLKDLFSTLISFVESMINRTEQITQKLESLSKKDLQLKEGIVKLGRYGKYVGDNGKVQNAAKIYVTISQTAVETHGEGNGDVVSELYEVYKDKYNKDPDPVIEVDTSKLSVSTIKTNIKESLAQVKTIKTHGIKPSAVKIIMNNIIKEYESENDVNPEEAAKLKRYARGFVDHTRNALEWCNRVYSAQISYVQAVTK